MPKFHPFKAQTPTKEVMAMKDTHPYMELVHRVQMPLGRMESTDPAYHDEILLKAREALQKILHQSLWTSYSTDSSYVLYQSTYRDVTQTGIIGLCEATDIGTKILPHEQILQDRSAVIAHWLQEMDLQWTPIFLSYRYNHSLYALQSSVVKKPCDFQYALANHTRVSLWYISDKDQIQAFHDAVYKIPRLYIADGHHRAAACQIQSVEDSGKPLEKAHSRHRLMLSILMADRDLKIYPFYRRIRNDQGPIPFWEILDKLKTIFRLKPCSLEQRFYQYLPAGHFLLVHKEGCWLLQPLSKPEKSIPKPENTNIPSTTTDVQWLQENVLGPICGINNPTTDPRIDFGSMNLTLENFRIILQEAATEFILIPRAPRTEEVFGTADRGEFMPPKSTSFEPKIPSGLVVYRPSEHSKQKAPTC